MASAAASVERRIGAGAQSQVVPAVGDGIRRLQEGPEWVWFAHLCPIPVIRSRWDLALCREVQGYTDDALAYLEEFLEHWHVPDELAAPEIEYALEMYENLTGEPYKPTRPGCHPSCK